MSLVQSIDYAEITPPLVIAVTALVVLVVDLFVPDDRRLVAAYVSLLGTAVALGTTAWLVTGPSRQTFCFASGGCSYVADDYTLFFQVLFLAALQDIPGEIIDAARVDGANRWQRFKHVILPHLRPVISMVVTLQLISTLRIFSQVYVMTNGGPASSSSS